MQGAYCYEASFLEHVPRHQCKLYKFHQKTFPMNENTQGMLWCSPVMQSASSAFGLKAPDWLHCLMLFELRSYIATAKADGLFQSRLTYARHSRTVGLVGINEWNFHLYLLQLVVSSNVFQNLLLSYILALQPTISSLVAAARSSLVHISKSTLVEGGVSWWFELVSSLGIAF